MDLVDIRLAICLCLLIGYFESLLYGFKGSRINDCRIFLCPQIAFVAEEPSDPALIPICFSFLIFYLKRFKFLDERRKTFAQ